MTVPGDDDGAGRPPAPGRPRHAAPSPSGSYVPPPQQAGDEPITNPLPRVEPALQARGAESAAQATSLAEPQLTSAGYDLAPPAALAPAAPAAPVAEPAGRHSAGRPSALRLVWIYPDLLSTYGDRGNLIILERRARGRGRTPRPPDATPPPP